MTQFDSVQIKNPKKQKNDLEFLNQSTTDNPRVFEKPPRPRLALFKVSLLTILIIFILGAMYVSEKIFAPAAPTKIGGFNILHPLEQLAGLFGLAEPGKMIGEKEDRINLIVGGIGGEGHDGRYLTDTIILASLKPSSQQISLVSLPRDLILRDETGRWSKINELYSLGKTTKAEPAGKYLLTQVSQNLDLPTPYYLVIDFSGFSKLIDDLGGIDVTIERSFTDYTYPTNDFKTKVVSFKAGWQHLTGEQALQFVRSRHSPDNNEGSDFARSKRQQLVIKAIKEKVMSWQTLLSPKKLTSLAQAFQNHLDTNITIDQFWHLYSIFKNFDVSNLFTFVLDDSPENFLVGGLAQNGAYVLQPKGGSWEPITLLVKNILSRGQLAGENKKIVVLNGTPIENLAFTMSQSLRNLGFTVTNFANAPSKDFSKTVIYDFTTSTKKTTAELLTNFLHGVQAPYLPDVLQTLKKNYPEMDLLVILGQDQQIKTQPLVPWLIPTSSSSTLISTTSLEIIDSTTTKTYE
ncbi:MAG: LCP family protein [Candidatus Komeilibacteria bacterium]|nr:LCP family protein [Candidatus Komeilibacteria bacterium]